MLSFFRKSRWLFVPLLLGCFATAHATEFSAADYDLYAGDFNNDGKTDLLYIAKSPDKPSGIALADATGTPQLGFQSWPSNFLNIPWSSGAYKAIIGDFNGDHCADILLQSQTAGTSYVLLANCNPANGPVGQIVGISQAIAQTTFGIAWSADQHQIIAGDFDGDGKTDLFLQATSSSGTSAIVLADTNGNLFTRTSGNCWSNGPQQCWTDGYEGMKWSTQSSLIYAGDFNGDGKTDLLIQAKPTWVMIDFDVAFPVPKFASQGFGIFLAQTADSSGAIIRTPNQLWSVNDLNGKWSPLNSTVVVGDFNGDGHADVMLQSRSGTNMLMLSSSAGQLASGTAMSGAAANWTSSTYKAIVGKFGGSSIPVLYLQATTAGGTNYLTGNVSGASVTVTASTMQISATPTAPATGVGATTGAADVTAGGTGRYTISLQLPRGTAGLTPQLALQYQHSGKNGLVGVGWGISGLSVISRCPMTVAQDGVAQGVQFLASDQYCLDGSRLRLTAGVQGADGSQYRTELETYALVTAHTSGTNGPVWFQVKQKNGEIYEYGNSPDSQVSGTAGTRVWALNAIRDRASNYIAFSYFNNTKNPVAACQEGSSQGSYRPCQIRYSGNTNQSTSPPYTVQFSYQSPRNAGEVLQHMYMGQSITEVNRLLGIQLLYAGAIVKQWKLAYDPTVTLSHMSRLLSVQECGLNSDCFPPTTFNWSNQQVASNGLPAVSSTAVTDNAYTYQQLACHAPWSIDINGDGVQDTIISNCYNPPSQGQVNLSVVLQYGTPKGQAARPSVTWTNGSTTGGTTINMSAWAPIGAMDLDGDGKQDFVFLASSVVWWIHQRADGTVGLDQAPAQAQQLWSLFFSTGVIAILDVDGDGFPDIVSPGGAGDHTHLYVTFHNRDGSPGYESTSHLAWTAPAGFTFGTATGYNMVAYNSALTAIDVDGDGRQDLLLTPTDASGNSYWMVLYSNGSGFNTGDTLTGAAQGTTPIAIDLNGDGCTDFVYTNTSFTLSYAISKCGVVAGSGLNLQSSTISALTLGPNVADVNGDGNQDLVIASATGLTTYQTQVVYSQAATFAAPVTVASVSQLWADRDGDGLPDLVQPGGPTYGNPSVGQYQSALGPKPDLMLSASDAFGNAVNFTYAPLNDPTVYTIGSGAIGKTQDLNGSVYVVKQLQSTDGVGGTYSLAYSYSSAHRNIQGRGFLGFGSRTITDSRTGLVTQESYNNNINADGTGWEFVGTLTERKIQQGPSGQTLQDTVSQWASIAPDSATNRRYPYLNVQTVNSYELNNTAAITTKKTTTTIDNYGTPYDIVTLTTEGSTGIHPGSSRTQETYTAPSQVLNDTTNWCLSKPQQTQITGAHTLTDGGTVTQSVAQVWDAVNCRVTNKNLDVGTSWELDQQFDYDAWNNVWHQYIKASNLPQTQRTSTFDYSTSTSPGQLLMTVTNALGQKAQYTWDDSRALRSTSKDPNLLQTQWFYDDFGRLTHELRPDGTGSRRSYSACAVSSNYCGDGLLRYMVQEDERDVHDAIITYRYAFYDSFGRVKYDESLGFGGALSVVETLYDPRGNVASKSMPYYAGTDAYKGISFSYDLYNRVVGTQQPTSDSDSTPTSTATVFNGLTVTSSDALGHTHTQVSDAWGDVLSGIDEGGNTTTYTYDGFSHLKSTTDASGNQSTLTYTDRGLRLTSSDPDMGGWSYTYDGAGEMLSQTDAKGQTTKFHYDALGRADNRTDWGASSPDTIWNWDTATNGIGQLGSVTGPSGYSETYTYDGSGRKNSETVAAAGGSHALNYGYDPTLGTLQTITYPTATSGRFEVLYEYQNGYLKDVKDYNSQSTIFWQAIAQDARGHVVNEQFGNGQQSYLGFDETNGRLNTLQTGPSGTTSIQNLNYTWDKVGNLLAREDVNQGLTEGFTYDTLYRLQTTTLNGSQTLSLTYDAIGNISTKSDVGGTSHSYDYTTAQSTCSYTGLTAQPHAVRNAGGTAYCYDANGNMVSRSGATVTWYPYNYPQTINQTGGNYSTFYYAPDRSRYRQTSLTGTVTEDRIYVAGLFERLNSSATGIEYRHYIVANGEKVAIKLLSATKNNTFYVHGDHLGSTDVVTDQTTGTVVIHESYDAWGRRRGSNWTGSPSSADLNTISSTTHIGYTAQEHLDNLSLIDLNGRVYDPTIARFVSADPYVVPYASQGLNRYSYTWNNPLNHTDSTGFCPDDTDTNCAQNNGSITSDRIYSASQQEITPTYRASPATVSPEAPSNSAQVTVSTPSDQQASADKAPSSATPDSGGAGASEGSASNQAKQEKMAVIVVATVYAPFFPSLDSATQEHFNAALEHEMNRLHWGEIADAAGLWLVKQTFGWIDCAGGRCTAKEEALSLASAPLLAIALPEEGEVAAASEVAQVTLNRAAGNAFRDELAGQLTQAGREVTTEVYKKTPFGKRFIDIEVSRNGTVLGGIETKVGTSRYRPLQQLKDWWLTNIEGYPVNLARKP